MSDVRGWGGQGAAADARARLFGRPAMQRALNVQRSSLATWRRRAAAADGWMRSQHQSQGALEQDHRELGHGGALALALGNVQLRQ